MKVGDPEGEDVARMKREIEELEESNRRAAERMEAGRRGSPEIEALRRRLSELKQDKQRLQEEGAQTGSQEPVSMVDMLRAALGSEATEAGSGKEEDRLISPEFDRGFKEFLGKRGMMKASMEPGVWKSGMTGKWSQAEWRKMLVDKGCRKAMTKSRAECMEEALNMHPAHLRR